ncbi:MAG: NUDIX domain-containing protein [Pseudomonadota bacterium]
MTSVSLDDFTHLTDIGSSQNSASVLLARDAGGRYLLQIRDNFPVIAAPGMLGLFGGHVERGEDLAECAVREFREETGIVITRAEIEPYVAFVSPSNADLVHFVFKLNRRISPADIVLEEGAGFVFFEPSQFANFPVLEAAKLAINWFEGE